MEVYFDKTSAPENAVQVPPMYFMYGVSQVDVTRRITAVAFRYTPETPVKVLTGGEVWKFKEHIHGFRGIVVPDLSYRQSFWWLSDDVNFCVVSSAGPVSANVASYMDVKEQFTNWMATNPTPPPTVFVVIHKQPAWRLNCEGCCRRATCVRPFRDGRGKVCHVCCKCLYSPRWGSYSYPGWPVGDPCRHTGVYGKWKTLEAERKAAIEATKTPRTPRWVEGAETDNICPICHGELSVPVMLECAHRFCLQCVHTWVHQDPPEPTCPLCRHNLTIHK